MTKVMINNIIIKNAKDWFLSDIKLSIFFEVFEPLREGLFIRAKLHGCLRGLC